MLKTPVLFLIFNRPDLTGLAFDRIREVKPGKLFIAADGPRKNKIGEVELCAQTRDIVLNNIDWKCEVETLFRETNLGCKIAVSSAITWFFERVEEGIIIEDDILPDTTFFSFCEELLQKYRFDNRVMTISGTNLLGNWKPEGPQSYFSGYVGIWGWASWRRAWKMYDIEMKDWHDEDLQYSLQHTIGSIHWFNFYKGMLNLCYLKDFDTWDVQWLYSILKNNGIAINPSVNLITNIGFGNNASHTHDPNSELAKIHSNSMSFPLKHPSHMMLNMDYMDMVASKFMIPAEQNFSVFKKTYARVKFTLKKVYSRLRLNKSYEQ